MADSEDDVHQEEDIFDDGEDESNDGEEDYKPRGKAVDSDEEEVDEAEVEAAFGESKKKRSRKSPSTKKSKKDESEKKRKKTKSSKPRQSKYRNLFQEEAAEAEDDEDEDFDGAEISQAMLTAEEQAAHRRVEERQRKLQEYYANLTEEQIAAKYDNLAKIDKEQRRVTQSNVQSRSQKTGFVPRAATLPDYNDPRIYKLRCKPGQEDIAIRSILLKAVDFRKRDGYSKVKSAFFGNSKGFIYVEAWSEAFVREIINTLRMIYPNSLAQIPTKDMTQLLEVMPLKKPLEEFQFVRMKRGPNKGDLARVLQVLDGGERVIIEVVPRLEYLDDAAKNDNRALGIRSASKVRPAQRYFDPEQARKVTSNGYIVRARHPTYQGDMHCDVYDKEFFHNGFLIKDVKTDAWISTSTDAKPTLEELKMFQLDHAEGDAYSHLEEVLEGSNDDDRDAPKDKISKMNKILAEEISKMQSTEVSPYVVGDMVQVIEGDLINLVAKVVSVDNKTQSVKVVPLNETFKGTFDVEMALLAKYVVAGAHVKVMSGTYTGTTGRVISVSSLGRDPIAVVMTDASQDEIQINTSLLQVSEDVAIGAGTLAGYELYDLVSLNDQESAVVIQVTNQKLRVMNNLAVVKDVTPQEIRSKQNALSQRAFAVDSSSNRFVVNDMVSVISGPMQGMSGTVKHIFKGVIWLHNNTHNKNSGVFVTRSRQCLLSGGSSSSQSRPITDNFKLNRMNNNAAPSGGFGGSGGSVASTPVSGGGSTYGTVGIGSGGFGIGSQIKITKGAYRSMLGVILNIDGSYVLVELSARMKKVYVKKEDIRLADSTIESTAASSGPSTYTSTYTGYDNFAAGAATPYLATQTPNYVGSETPRYGSETPSHYGSETPSFSDYGAATPRHNSDDVWRITAMDLDEHRSSAYDNSTPGPSLGQTPNDERRIPTSHTVTPMSAVSSYYSVPNTPLDTHSIVTSSVAPTFIEGMVVLITAGLDMGKLAVIMSVDLQVRGIIVDVFRFYCDWHSCK